MALRRAFLWVRWGWAHMAVTELTSVTLHVTLGPPPTVSAEVHGNPCRVADDAAPT